MNRDEFAKVLSRNVYPALRKEGFRGSGSTLRRITEPVVHIFNMQGSSGGERCYFNLGVHLIFLPPEGGGTVEPGRLLEYHCMLRERIDPPGAALGWVYGQSESEVEATAVLLLKAWHKQAVPFFSRYSTFPEDFRRLVDQFQPENALPSNSLNMARLALHFGMTSRAAQIAHSALERTSAQATVLKSRLEDLIDRSEAT